MCYAGALGLEMKTKTLPFEVSPVSKSQLNILNKSNTRCYKNQETPKQVEGGGHLGSLFRGSI